MIQQFHFCVLPNELNALVQRDSCTLLYMVVLFTTVRAQISTNG